MKVPRQGRLLLPHAHLQPGHQGREERMGDTVQGRCVKYFLVYSILINLALLKSLIRKKCIVLCIFCTWFTKEYARLVQIAADCIDCYPVDTKYNCSFDLKK